MFDQETQLNSPTSGIGGPDPTLPHMWGNALYPTPTQGLPASLSPPVRGSSVARQPVPLGAALTVRSGSFPSLPPDEDTVSSYKLLLHSALFFLSSSVSDYHLKVVSVVTCSMPASHSALPTLWYLVDNSKLIGIQKIFID